MSAAEDVSLFVANTDAEWARAVATAFGKERAAAEYMTYDVVGKEARDKARPMNVFDRMTPPVALEDHTAVVLCAGAMGPGNPGVVVKSVTDKGDALEVKWDVVEPVGARNRSRMIQAADFFVLAPGESRLFVLNGEITDKKMLVVHELLGGIWHWPLADGEYTVRAVFDRRGDDDAARRLADRKDYWAGGAPSPEIKVVVDEQKTK